MATNLQLSTTLQNAFLTTAVLNLFNGGVIEIRTGTQPANANATATGTVLTTLTLGNPAFGSITNGSSSANTIATVTAAATGTAGYARVYQTGGTVVLMDLSVGTSASNLVLTTASILAGGPVTVSSFVFSVLAQGQ